MAEKIDFEECRNCIYNNSDKSCYGHCETYPANGNELEQASKISSNKTKKGD